MQIRKLDNRFLTIGQLTKNIENVNTPLYKTVSTNSPFDEFKRQQIFKPNVVVELPKKKDNKKIITGVVIALVIAIGIGIKMIKKPQKNKVVEPIISDIVGKFDKEYKEKLLLSMGLDPQKIEVLNSICGKNEFINFLSNIKEETKGIFSVGKNFENVKNKTFGANLHIHTNHSDGQMSVAQLLEISSKYANKYFKKNKKPFFIAITDHNTTNGCKEALQIISKNPEKYKNLKVVLGTEINAFYDDIEVHTLNYCINPFKSNIQDVLDDQLIKMQNNIKNTINKANIEYSPILKKYGFKFSFDDMAKIRSSIKSSPCDINYSMKDYLQFRLIFADLVENNSNLKNLLVQNNISISDLDFSIPKFNIMNDNSKKNYYEYYILELEKYINKVLKNRNSNFSNNIHLKPLNKDTIESLSELEHWKHNTLRTQGIKYKNFDEILNCAEKDGTLFGIAHPCLIYEKGKVVNDEFKIKSSIKSLFDKLSKKEKMKKISESYYQAYWENTVANDCASYAKTYADINNFLHTGGYDSHNNNPFTDQKYLPETFLL